MRRFLLVALVLGCSGTEGKLPGPMEASDTAPVDLTAVVTDVATTPTGTTSDTSALDTGTAASTPGLPLADLEHCDGRDEDGDGTPDDRCVTARDAVPWTPTWAGTPAQPSRYCSPPFHAPEGAEIRCSGTAPAAVTTGPIDVGQWYAYRTLEGEAPDGVALWTAPAEGAEHWVLSATLRIDTVDIDLHIQDGQSFGWLGLVFEDDDAPASGVRFFPESFPRVDYRGPYGPGASAHRVSVGEPLAVRLVRYDRDLSLYLDGAYVGRATVPASDPAAERHLLPVDPPLSRIQLACVNCTATWSEVELFQPAVPPDTPPLTACENRLRNGSVEAIHDGVPDHWGISAPDAIDGVARRGPDVLASYAAVQSVSGGTDGAWAVQLNPPAVDGVPTRLLQSFPLPPRSCPTCADPDDLTTCGSDLVLALDARGLGPDAQLNVTVTGAESLIEREVADVDGVCVAEPADLVLACTPEVSAIHVAEGSFTRHEVRLTGCAFSDGPYPIRYGTVSLSAAGADAVQLDAVQIQAGTEASAFCGRWEDVPLAAAPTAAFEPPVEVGGPPRALHRTADGRPAGQITVGHTASALTVDVQLEEPSAGDAVELRVDPGGAAYAPYRLRLDMTGAPLDADAPPVTVAVTPTGLALEVPFAALVQDATAGPVWSLQVVHRSEDAARTAALAPDVAGPLGSPRTAHPLVWSEPPWALPEPVAYALMSVPAWADRAWSTVLAYPTHGTAQPEQLADLGIGSVSHINPHQTSIGSFAEYNAAVATPLDQESHTFQVHEVWRTDDEWALFHTYAEAIADAQASWGQPGRWAVMDEPRVTPLAKCRADLGSGVADYGSVRPATAEAMAALGCGGDVPCDALQAYLACFDGLPADLSALATSLRATLPPEVPLGLNLTPAGAVEWGDAIRGFDYVSTTHNWAFTHLPRAWDPAALRHLQAVQPETAFVGYNDILGPYESGPAERAADAVALRGLSWWFLAEGAVAVRHFVWPATTAALYPTLAELETELEALRGVVPGGALTPTVPTSTPEVVARAFADGDSTVLVVVNGTERVLHPRVDVRGLGARAAVLDGRPAPVLEDGVLAVGLAGFEARVLRLSD